MRARTGGREAAIVETSMWLLFLKAVMLVPVTLWTFARAYRSGRQTPAVGVACCAAGTFAFTMACVAAWIRSRLG